MSDSLKSELTRYGFRYGAVEVTRLGSYRGSVEIGLKTDGESLSITVSPAGQKVRVFSRDGREWKPEARTDV